MIVEDVAAGDEFSIFVGRNKASQETEVYSCGNNTKGQLGIGTFNHDFHDLSKFPWKNFDRQD